MITWTVWQAWSNWTLWEIINLKTTNVKWWGIKLKDGSHVDLRDCAISHWYSLSLKKLLHCRALLNLGGVALLKKQNKTLFLIKIVVA